MVDAAFIPCRGAGAGSVAVSAEDDRVAAREIVLAMTPRAARAALAALFALDARLGAILASTSQPILGQMRLAWWREALERLDRAPPPAEPVLAELAAYVLPTGVRGAALARMADGWEALLTAGDAPDEAALTRFAEDRGGALFSAASEVLGAAPLADAGQGWALADLVDSSGATGARARAMAVERPHAAFRGIVPRRARPLGTLALLAAMALRARPRPLRDATSLIGFRLTGRHRLVIA